MLRVRRLTTRSHPILYNDASAAAAVAVADMQVALGVPAVVQLMSSVMPALNTAIIHV